MAGGDLFMVLSGLMEWISPLAWWVIECAWLALAIFSLGRPGGIGSRLFLTGTAISFALSTVSTIDDFRTRLTGDGGLWENDWLYYAFDVAWLLSSALAIGGLFLILLRIRRIMDHFPEPDTPASPPPVEPAGTAR